MADRVVAGIVVVSGGKILLVLSRKDEDSRAARWSIPKGRHHEAADGGLFATAARELLEETGLDLGGLDERQCASKGVLTYTRKGRNVELHYFVVERSEILLDPLGTAGEAMSGVGLFTPAMALRFIRREQRPLVEALRSRDAKGENARALARILRASRYESN